MSGDLAGWLLTQISEDEGVGTVGAYRDLAEALRNQGMGLAADWLTARRARVLAECAAKRAIIEPHTGGHRCAWGDWYQPGECDAKVLCILASVYSDRPGFRPEWQVTP